MSTLGSQIIDRCTADRGTDTYSQPYRDQPGYSDCSSYLRRVLLSVAGVDPGTYTTAISEDPDGRLVTTSPEDVRAGRFQEGDVILWGWATDHRAGYPYSHVGFLTHAGGSWDQYGDIAPHNGPTFHPMAWGLMKADRIRVLRFIPDEVGAPLAVIVTKPMPAVVPASGALVVDGQLGPRTIARLQQYLGGLDQDGIMGPRTRAMLQRYLGVTVDSIIGPNTVRALQRKVGATIDGQWGPDTTRHLQAWLNAQR